MVKTITFEYANILLNAQYYLPHHAGPHPSILIVPGFGMTLGHGVASGAQQLAEKGFAVLAFDYLGLGENKVNSVNSNMSTIIDFSAEREQLHCAIHWLAAQNNIDATRIGLWATSLGAAHAFHLASTTTLPIKTLALLMPFIDGVANFKDALGERKYELLNKQLNTLDDSQLHQKQFPLLKKKSTPGLFHSDAATQFYARHETYEFVTYHTVKQFLTYSVLNNALDLKQSCLFQLAENDDINLTQLQLDMYQNLYCHKAYRLYPGNHFGVYLTQQASLLTDCLRWFKHYL